MLTRIAIAVATASFFAVACSSEGDSTTRQGSSLMIQTGPSCDFKCECEKKGGTVDPNDDAWCCKASPDGSKTCTNRPQDIIEWLTASSLPPAKNYGDKAALVTVSAVSK